MQNYGAQKNIKMSILYDSCRKSSYFRKLLMQIRKPIQISLNTTILHKIIRHFMTQDQNQISYTYSID